ncbi:MAG: hypothetical protein R2726_23660, partial [Acidimicrobiales bacterium]
MLERLRRRSYEEGLLGGNLPYLLLAAVFGASRGLRIATRREEEVVLAEALRPGETLVIAHQEATVGRAARRRRRRDR